MWSLPGFAQAGACRAAEIIDQHLDGPDEALRIADQLAEEIGWSPIQEDGRAAILLRRGDFTGALDIWRRILPAWQPQSELDLQQQFSCREAAIAAARLGSWGEAADWLAEARVRTGTGGNDLYEAALLIDEGYARWKSEDSAAALPLLHQGLVAIERLPADEVDERTYVLRKRAGRTLMWMASVTNGTPPEQFAAPPPACCSGLDPPQGPRETSTPHDIMWAYLVEFELAADLGDTLLRAHERRLTTSEYGVVRVSIGNTLVRHRVKYLILEDLVSVAVRMAESLELCRRYTGVAAFPATTVMPAATELSADGMLSIMLSGVFALIARGGPIAETIETWRAAAGQAGILPTVEVWLDLAEGLFVTRSANAAHAMRDEGIGWAST